MSLSLSTTLLLTYQHQEDLDPTQSTKLANLLPSQWTLVHAQYHDMLTEGQERHLGLQK